MIFIRTFLFLVFTLFVVPSLAAEEAAPFGFEIGTDTLMSSRTKATERGYAHKIDGENKYTGGLMLDIDVSSAQVNGVKKLILIFDQQEILQGVTFDSRKHHFNDFDGFISQKYVPVKRQVPFVGNKYVEYQAPNAIIKLNAPHMGFEMNIVYASQELLSSFNSISKAEDAQEKKKAASQF
ncbi:hypothetical protein RYZ26_06860 [Terasakiella sp. A23]|uniref:hypothetical protein n=1 Tax=Terasakiella sp. FCG-A23 TaxID=3080561 RepID=UPI00295440C0|nr:hypothetical protein [Terasakiella sp. A23]MDV7339306.1 hypothetical protein [Terasakiella sp. A23]